MLCCKPEFVSLTIYGEEVMTTLLIIKGIDTSLVSLRRIFLIIIILESEQGCNALACVIDGTRSVDTLTLGIPYQVMGITNLLG